MQTYRAYILESDGSMPDAHDFQAEDDRDALRTAVRFVQGNAVILKSGNRLIGMLNPRRPRVSVFAQDHASLSH
jgi:hypothetical protein